MREWIYGRNPVMEVVAAGRRHVFRLLIAQGVKMTPEVQSLRSWCHRRKVPFEQPAREALDAIAVQNQGIAIEVSGYPYVAVEDLLRPAGEPDSFFLILDTLHDPQNLGSLLRTAEAVGVKGVIMPAHRSAKVTPAVVSASSGACEHLKIAQANLAGSIRELKARGVFVYGLAQGPGAFSPRKSRLDGPIALVVGNEGSGMRRLVRENCDALVELPMVGKIASLNAATAGSVLLYEIFYARQK